MEKNTILLKLICPAIIVLLLNMPSYKSANYQSLSWFKIKSWFKIIDTFVLFSKDACLPCRHKRGVLGGFFTAGRNIWPDYTQKDRKTLGTQHQAGSACSVCLRVGQIKGTWWNRRIWKREGWVQENEDRDEGVEKQRHEAGMRVKNRGQRVGREQHRQPGIRGRANKRSEGGGMRWGKRYWRGKQRNAKCLGTRKRRRTKVQTGENPTGRKVFKGSIWAKSQMMARYLE